MIQRFLHWFEGSHLLSQSRRRAALCGLLAAFFSFVTLVGASFRQQGSASPLFSGARAAVASLALGLLLYALYDLTLATLFHLLDRRPWARLSGAPESGGLVGDLPPGRAAAADRRFLRLAFLAIVVSYLPMLVLLYPGNLPHDGYYQIDQFMGVSPLHNGHPFVSTVVIGSIFSIGRVLGGDNFGVFLYVCIQSVAMALVFAKASLTIRELGHARLARASVAFFALCPIWPLYAATVIKDTLFLMAFVGFTLAVVDQLRRGGAPSAPAVLKLAAISLLVCWTRHNGVYVVIPTLVALALSSEGARPRLGLTAGLVLIACWAMSSVVLPALHVEPSSPNEMMSVPYQQTARYVIMHPDDLTEEERDIIRTSIDYDRIPELYNPEISDPIKGSLPSNRPTSSYLGLWARMLLRHPMTCVSATFHNTYGYYYPFANFDVMATFQLYIKGDPVDTGDFDIHYALPHDVLASSQSHPDQFAPGIVSSYASAWRSLPALRLLTRPGVYAWVLLALAARLLDTRRYTRLVAFMPAALAFLSCLVSPVNGLLRYAMPYMAVTVLLAAFALANDGPTQKDAA